MSLLARPDTVTLVAPQETVIRINGHLDETLYRGWVFEKGDSYWESPGSEYQFTDAQVQSYMDAQGFQVLYVPEAT